MPDYAEWVWQQARYVARLVQGSQALEAAAVDADGYQRLVELAAEEIARRYPAFLDTFSAASRSTRE